MTFFYDLNKRLDGIRATPETTHGQLNERDEGKPGKNFAKIAKDAGERYGSKAAGERVAGAVRNKLEEQDMDESAFQAAIGKKKYGDEGMKALQKAGRDHASDATMDNIRDKYDKYDEGVYQGGPDKSKIPAYQRPNDPMTLKDLEKERTQSPTSPEGMRALQDKLKNIHPLDEVGDTPAGLAAVQKVGRRADRAIGDAGTGYSGSELDNPDKTYAARDRANSIVGRERIRANDKNPTRVVGGPNNGDRMEEAGEQMTPKQKSFAKLAPPADKITFADKIAGAKKRSHMKEADMEEGNDFTGARLDAIRAGKPTFKVGGKSYRVSGDTSQERAMSEARDDDEDDVYAYQDDSKKKTHKTASGGTVTRHGGVTRHQAAPGHYGGYDPETDPDKDDDKSEKPAGEKRGRGRPKGPAKAPERVTAKAYKHKGTRKVKEDDDIDFADHGEYDREGEMAQQDLRTAADAAMELRSILDSDENLPEWVQSKITKAVDYLDTSRDYMKSKEIDEAEMNPAAIARFNEPNKKFYTKNPHFTRGTEVKDVGKTVDASGKPISALATKVTPQNKPAPVTKKPVTGFKEEELDEKAVSKAQRRAAAIAMHAPKSELRGASKEMSKMPKKELEKFASTKEKGLPKKKDEAVEENTVAGAVATAPSGGGSKSKGGMQFGKGVYEGAIAESFNAKLDSMLAEGMNMNMSTDSEGHKSLSVTATDEDAVSLAEILKMAGLGGNSSGYKQACPGCGSTDCGCDHIEEDQDLANSADNTVYADTDYMVNDLSGGLNDQKSTGQTTGAPFNRQPQRQGAMTEETEQKLWNLFKKY